MNSISNIPARYGKQLYPSGKYLSIKLPFIFAFTSGIMCQILGIYSIYVGFISDYYARKLVCLSFGLIIFISSFILYGYPYQPKIIYEKGIDIRASVFDWIKRKQNYIKISEINIITPTYIQKGNVLQISNFKFYYKKVKFFVFKYNKVEYINLFRRNFKKKWASSYDENYDINNLDWNKYKYIINIKHKKAILHSILTFTISLLFLLIYFHILNIHVDYFIGTATVIFTLIISVLTYFVVLIVDPEEKGTLLKFLYLFGNKSLQKNIIFKEDLETWQNKNKITHIETIDEWFQRNSISEINK